MNREEPLKQDADADHITDVAAARDLCWDIRAAQATSIEPVTKKGRDAFEGCDEALDEAISLLESFINE